MKTLLMLACAITGLTFQTSGQAPAASQLRGSESVLPLSAEAPPKLIVDAPLAEPLSQGRVIIQYRTENLRIVPVFGSGALDVSPRIGHLHVSVDDTPWHWAHASNDQPLIIVGLLPGPHRVLVELADPNHKVLESKVIAFEIPASKQAATYHH